MRNTEFRSQLDQRTVTVTPVGARYGALTSLEKIPAARMMDSMPGGRVQRPWSMP
jgi:hypothetical protein